MMQRWLYNLIGFFAVAALIAMGWFIRQQMQTSEAIQTEAIQDDAIQDDIKIVQPTVDLSILSVNEPEYPIPYPVDFPRQSYATDWAETTFTLNTPLPIVEGDHSILQRGSNS